MATKSTSTQKTQDITKMMEEWFMKFPPLPENGKKNIVMAMPWIALIFGVLGVLVGIAGLGALTVLSPLLLVGAGMAHAGGSIIAAIISLAGSVLLLMAYQGTKAKKMAGWNLLFWSQGVWVLSSLLSLSLVGLLIDALGFYILFQIKSYYK